MKKAIVIAACAAVINAFGLTYISNPAHAAHRLSDKQIMSVIASAPTGASITVPADFFRDVVAGKYRWRNATNWIARSSNDPTMVTALDSMDSERKSAIIQKNEANSNTNRLTNTIISLTNKIEQINVEWYDKWSVSTNQTADALKKYKAAVDQFIAKNIELTNAVHTIYVRTQERDTEKALKEAAQAAEAVAKAAQEKAETQLATVKSQIVTKRAEIQSKYDKASAILKPVYKAFLDILDKILELFEVALSA